MVYAVRFFHLVCPKVCIQADFCKKCKNAEFDKKIAVSHLIFEENGAIIHYIFYM